MSKTTYNIQLKGYVGGWDFDRADVDDMLAQNEGKPVNVLIDSLGGSLATGLSPFSCSTEWEKISAAFKNHGDVFVHFVGLNASAATIGSSQAKRQADDARCQAHQHRCRCHVSLWKKSVYGPTLAEIKADKSMIEKFAVAMYGLIQQLLGHCLSSGDWCLVTSPKRRHKERNFATLISARLAALLNIPFYEDLAHCESRHRVGAIFSLSGKPPKEHNIIIFDDFVTSGATIQSMKNLLAPLGYNLLFFTAINNKS